MKFFYLYINKKNIKSMKNKLKKFDNFLNEDWKDVLSNDLSGRVENLENEFKKIGLLLKDNDISREVTLLVYSAIKNHYNNFNKVVPDSIKNIFSI